MSTDTSSLDLRGVAEGDQLGAFLAFHGELAPGEAATVTCGRDHGFLLAGLEQKAAGTFEWWPVESGPTLWRVVVARRKQDGEGLTIEDLFTRDHRRMREMLQESREAVGAGDRQLAASHFAEFRVGIERHVRGEERILFPIFRASGLKEVDSDLKELAREHREIGKQLEEILALFGSEERFDQPLLEESMKKLWATIQTHEDREERIFLPLCDRLLTDRERSEALGSARKL